MSFRLFVYYCALCGGLAAFVGWVLGRPATGRHEIGEAGLKGLFLGLFVALALGLLDTIMSVSAGSRREARVGVIAAGIIGGLGGLMAAVLGQVLYGRFSHWAFLLLGWTLTGMAIGASIGAFAYLARLMQGQDLGPAWSKVRRGLLGGGVGGILGGSLFLLLKIWWEGVFRAKAGVSLWSPSATGFVALGACIGLAVGLAEVILKDAWLVVESGFRAGREVLLSKTLVTIGRAESCDIGLFGDPAIEKLHARIVREGDRFLLVDENTPAGTLLNGARIADRMPLRPGDRIQIGRNVLRFGETRKRTTAR
jgi:hypothetical protein